MFKRCVSDFLSELGIEKEDDEEDSQWDSEVSLAALISLAAKVVYSPVCKSHSTCSLTNRYDQWKLVFLF